MQYSTEDAANKAKAYCEKNKGWQRICDIENSDALMLAFEELPAKVQNAWKREYPSNPKGMWEEFGSGISRHPYKFVSGAGEVFDKATDVPYGHQLMMIFNTSKTRKAGYP